jgi:hypothetical protein
MGRCSKVSVLACGGRAGVGPIQRSRRDGRHLRKRSSNRPIRAMPTVVNIVIEKSAAKTSGVSRRLVDALDRERDRHRLSGW